MSDDTNKKRLALAFASSFEPFNPSMANDVRTGNEMRIAWALEYIAAQLGEINRRQREGMTTGMGPQPNA